MWKENGKTTTLSLFLQSLFPKTDVLEEAVDLSYDRLLMMMMKATSYGLESQCGRDFLYCPDQPEAHSKIFLWVKWLECCVDLRPPSAEL
jgi:hypothetical protein